MTCSSRYQNLEQSALYHFLREQHNYFLKVRKLATVQFSLIISFTEYNVQFVIFCIIFWHVS